MVSPISGTVSALPLQLLEDARALFFVEIHEHGVRVGGLDLADVGREIGLARLGREIGHHFGAEPVELLDDDVAAAAAEIVVDPDHGHRLRLHLVVDVFRDLRHRGLLAERSAEQVLVALLRQLGGLATHDLRDAGLGGERRGDLHRAGIAGPEQHIGLGVERLLHLRAGDAGVGLRVGVGDLQLAAEHAALGVDLLDREVDAVLPVGSDGGAAAGQLGDVGELDRLGVGARCGHDGEQRAHQ
ncbi:hypothetical protein ACVMBZ_007014 [Bradyrhizobium liaoningense]